MSISNELKALVNEYNQAFKMISDSSYDAYVKTLPQYTPLPKKGQIYGDEYRARLAEKGQECASKAREIIDKHTDDIKAKRAAAPSAEATNILTLLAVRKNVTQTELDDIASAYGSNYQVARTLASIARDNNLMPPATAADIDEHADAVSDVARQLNSYFRSTPKNDAEPAIFGMVINQAFPEEFDN